MKQVHLPGMRVVGRGWLGSDVTSSWVDRWRRFLREHEDPNIFHTPEMYDVFADTPDCRPAVLSAVSSGRIRALMMPVRVRLTRLPVGRLAWRILLHGGILAERSEEGQEAVLFLLHRLRSEARGFEIEVRNLSNRSLDACLTSHHFREHVYVNYRVDLAEGPNAVWSRISGKGRKTIRNALNKDTRVTEVHDRTTVQDIYRLLQKSYRRAGVPLPDRSLFYAAYDHLKPKGMARFFVVRMGGTCIAGSVELIYRDTVYGWYQGYDSGFSKYRPNDLLMWHVLKWGLEQGYRCYDFGGAGRPGEPYGVREFKAKFGGRLVDDPRYQLDLIPGIRRVGEAGLKGYRTLRRLRRE